MGVSLSLISTNMTQTAAAVDVKLVIVGDGACGKTSLLNVFVHNKFPEDYTPTVFDNQIKHVIVDGREVKLALWDTAGQEDYDKLRPLSYDCVDVFVVVYSIDDPGSLYNTVDMWLPEIRQYCDKTTPVILVGNKSDLRNYNSKPGNTIMELVGESEGKEVAKKIDNAVKCIECSALTGEKVSEVFFEAIRATKAFNPALNTNAKKKSGCFKFCPI